MKVKPDYKIFLVIPVALLLFSLHILISSYITTGEWFKKSFELKGGSLITIATQRKVDISKISTLIKNLGEMNIRETRGIYGYQILIEMGNDVNVTRVIEILRSAGIDKDSISVSSFETALSTSFWQQSQIAIAFAFIFMGVIVFFIFKTFVPSVAVILSAFSDIVTTLAFMQILGIRLSLAGMGALLMLIGYSVDTDILLTSRLLKDRGDVKKKLIGALKTGLMMSITTISVLVVVLFFSSSLVLSQIAQVLLIGLFVDLVNTWLQNSIILRWYMERGVEI